MVDERHGTVPGLVGGTARRRFIGGGRGPRLSTAYLLLSLFGLTVFLRFLGRMLRAIYIYIYISMVLS